MIQFITKILDRMNKVELPGYVKTTRTTADLSCEGEGEGDTDAQYPTNRTPAVALIQLANARTMDVAALYLQVIRNVVEGVRVGKLSLFPSPLRGVTRFLLPRAG